MMVDTEKIGAGEPPKNTSTIPYWRLVIDQAGITQEVIDHKYPGSGTEEDPYVIQWIPDDPRNPMEFAQWKKWFITMAVAVATLAVALDSSAYTGGLREILLQFGISQEVATLGVSLFVLGFAIGPLLWAPLSELFGRQVLFFFTYGALSAFCAGAAGAQNSWTLIILRFFAGAFGSSPLTNAGGVIADLFPAAQRGVAMSLFAAAPFLGPVLGPIIGGFLGMNKGWRWVMGFLAIFSGALWIIVSLIVPETYAPVILRKRAAKLSHMTGKCYVSKIDHDRGKINLNQALKTALLRPWILLFMEPIVFLLSLYMAIVYGTLYMLFAAFPIVYEQHRGWNQGVAGLPFLGVLLGVLCAICYSLPDNKRYIRAQERNGGFAPPESRLPPIMLASVAMPVGLFWFAWTNSPSVHWLASVAASVPFGFGMVLVFLGVMNYLIDAYTIFAASVLAANAVLRSCFGAAFPLFTTYMYNNLGIHWASTIPAFLALACCPFPFIFYKYGAAIRARCKFAAESDAFMRKMREAQAIGPVAETSEQEADELDGGSEKDEEPGPLNLVHSRASRVSRASTALSRRPSIQYEGNPYDIDRVNTRESFH